MKRQPLGKGELVSSRLAYGCMRIAGTWKPQEVTPERAAAGRRAVLAAYEAGYTLFDHADIYCRGMCETIFGQALKENPGMRDRIVVATKCGIRFPGDPNPDSPHRYDLSAEHILRSCDGSLQRLGIERIDLYQLHRPDLLMDPYEVAGAFEKLRAQGKVREFGVSNFSPSFMTALRKACPFPLIVNQVEIHLGRLDCLYNGTLDQCLAETMTPLAWSPLGGGYLAAGGLVPWRNPRRKVLRGLLAAMDEIAARLQISRTVLALSWLLRHPSRIIPIVGTTDPARIRESAKADDVALSREEWYRLLVAARAEKLP
jgi:predicted oxidoreductase